MCRNGIVHSRHSICRHKLTGQWSQIALGLESSRCSFVLPTPMRRASMIIFSPGIECYHPFEHVIYLRLLPQGTGRLWWTRRSRTRPLRISADLAPPPPEVIYKIFLKQADLKTLVLFAAVNRLTRAFILGLPKGALQLVALVCPQFGQLRHDPFNYIIQIIGLWCCQDAIMALLVYIRRWNKLVYVGIYI
ncbi:hypothetical protein F5X99DRAFT_93548 [Biscogniauxia marginata]|nr:hypothetical protein F5X99DRAFT_93548 [Biscogniauxia marginata]